MTSFTKGEIDRLGKNIRIEYFEIKDETIDSLQEYRTSHQLPLANVFKLICSIAKSIHHSSIATYRIKRFESIINKLDRYPDMRFSRMWDIAGCRIILRNEDEVYKTIEKIRAKSEIEIVKINDYIETPQPDGYKSIHLYLKHSSSNIIVEVQLRTLKNHNWATLVEITDLLFNTRIKEIGDDKTLLEFHGLLSNTSELTIQEKYKIFEILREKNYFEKLSEVFSKNYLIVRKQWLTLEAKTNHRYFLIEVDNNTPNIKSFSSFVEAEKEYFELYRNKTNTNVVLTYLQNHNYELLATAYANYILTFHSFLFECLEIIETLITDCLEEKKSFKLQKVYSFYNDLIYRFNKNTIQELDDSVETYFNDLPLKVQAKLNKKRKLWIEDINKQLIKLRDNQFQVAIKVQNRLKESGVKNIILKYIIKFSNRKYRKLTKRLIGRSTALGPMMKKANQKNNR
ncbi:MULTISPECIES: hypothetical protein [unclassified Sphingobacterium]|uniref:hypothetical protein n=1 Tax=unclassified Sphingobacterium TaxID=2609468 RepID=UPI0025D2E838|nr:MULTISPECIES: hypothetical protein [unclassified Sphingobacterium]